MSEIEAIAEVWASIDGKLREFALGRAGDDAEGYYEGYLAEATEMLGRLLDRGFQVVPIPSHPNP